MDLSEYRPYLTVTGLTGDYYEYRKARHQRVTHTRHLSKEQAFDSYYRVIAQDGTTLCTGTVKHSDNFCRKRQNGEENFHHSPSRNHGLIEHLKRGQAVTVYVRPKNQ